MICPFCGSAARSDYGFECGSGPNREQRSIACRDHEIRRLRVRVADLDDELVEAKARIAKLENELNDNGLALQRLQNERDAASEKVREEAKP